MRRSLLWMLGGFIVLLALIAALRARSAGDVRSRSSRAGADEIRTFWETYHRATAARLAGDYAAAAIGYRDALELDDQHQDSRFYLATSLEALGRYREAVGALRELVALYPEHSRAWSQLGSVLATKAPGAAPDLAAAEAAFGRAQAINSEHTGPFVRRGQLALERGDLDRARELFGIASDAGSPEAAFFAGVAAYLDDDLRAASEAFIQVLERSDREAAIAGRGASSEGDVSGELTPLDRARIRSQRFLYWTAHRLGGYPQDVPDAYRVDAFTSEASFELVNDFDLDGRGAFTDLDRDGETNLVVATATGLYVDGRRVDAGACWDVVPLEADGDGWIDLYVVGGGYTEARENRLLRNVRGALTDVTDSWGLGGARPTTRALAADLDGDGDTDLLEVGSALEGFEPARVYLQRAGRFEQTDVGVSYGAHAVDAAVADVDGDGMLDALIVGWKAPGRLFRNTGASFEDVTDASGLGGVGGSGFSALFTDFDSDGDPDLLVTAHASMERSLVRSTAGPTLRLFRNDGRGHFTDRTSEAGLDASFGVMDAVAADLDGDGRDDLVLALGGLDAWHLEPSVVLRNRDGEAFTPWALLPSPNDPVNAVGVAVSDGRVFLSSTGVFRSPSP